MKMKLFGRGKNVHDLVMKHVDAVLACNMLFVEAIEHLCTNGIDQGLEGISLQVGEAETVADSIRHEIIRSLLEGALLPESRREILKLIEGIDNVANQSEEIIKQITLQKIVFVKEIQSYILQINEKTRKQLEMLREVINQVFINSSKAYEYYEQIIRIEQVESEVDKLESKAIQTLFQMNIELARKNQLKTIITDIAHISDIVEDISDMLEMIMVLRKV
jgi:predicted phosphate transport protein (TIGR00153 family)